MSILYVLFIVLAVTIAVFFDDYDAHVMNVMRGRDRDTQVKIVLPL